MASSLRTMDRSQTARDYSEHVSRNDMKKIESSKPVCRKQKIAGVPDSGAENRDLQFRRQPNDKKRPSREAERKQGRRKKNNKSNGKMERN